jgi:hypothetical protein
MGSNNPSGNERDQFSPEAGEIKMSIVEVSINVSVDILVKVREGYGKTDLVSQAQYYLDRHGIKEELANVEENI